MQWFQVLTIVISITGFNLWFRRESRSDMRHFESEIRAWKNEINKQTKDFHGRLCTIEEKNRSK